SVSLNGANSATTSFVAPTVEKDTTIEFILTVTDDEDATEEDSVEVEIKAPADPDPAREPKEDQSDEPSPPTPDKEEEKQVKEDVGEEQDVDPDLNSDSLQIPETIVETCFDGVNIDNDGQFDEECEP
ncbi:MAG: hypothetical protein ACR2IS_20445, partial [Nitrososphaeraceae archaeon]